jgi:extracellular factor (EF) 3-hydroxypalmitic acid methyl ester biosynthesis protein
MPIAVNGEMKESLVVFKTSQGVESRASLLRLTRHSVVLELCSSASDLRASEVLADLKIILHSRTLYSGRAVVSNVMDTGLVTVCEATLSDAWADVDFSDTVGLTKTIGPQFGEFVQQWQKLYRVLPEYKVAIADLQTFLTDLRLWLEQVEVGVRSAPTADRIQMEQEAVQRLQPSVVPAINSLFERFEEVALRVEPDLVPAHQAFGKRLVHPLLLGSPFVYRTYAKPLGYAGDYEMVNMMFRDPAEGASLFAKMVNIYALQLPPIIGHRNRITYLTEQLIQETRCLAARQRKLRVFTLGCGPAHEVQRFIAGDALSSHAHLTLADFNDETINRTTAILNEVKRRHGRETSLHLIKKSVHHLLKQADRTTQYTDADRHDFIYCAGLFDYLSNKVCQTLMGVFYDMLAPGGLLVATNVDVHPARGEMECFLEWHLIHRNTEQMQSITPRRAKPHNVTLKRDPTGVNVFMEVRKPNDEN